MFALPDGAFFAVAGPRDMGETSRTIGFLVADLGAAVAELRAAGVEVGEPAANERHRYVHFRAPDGKLYELGRGALTHALGVRRRSRARRNVAYRRPR